MLAKQYAFALYALSRKSSTERDLLQSLKRVLELKGHTKLYNSIIRELGRIFERRETYGATLTVANLDKTSSLSHEIEREAEKLNVNANALHVRVDERIIGGFRIEFAGKSVDATHRTALSTLYKSVTKEIH